MILKEQNCPIVNQFEEEKFFHTEVLVKPLSISHLIFSSCLHSFCSLELFSYSRSYDMSTLYRLNCLHACTELFKTQAKYAHIWVNMTGPKPASVNVLTNIMSV